MRAWEQGQTVICMTDYHPTRHRHTCARLSPRKRHLILSFISCGTIQFAGRRKDWLSRRSLMGLQIGIVQREGFPIQ
jgi:hypothetical protein